MVPRDTPVKLVCGLVAPDEARPRASAPIAASMLPRRADYFHPATVAVHRGENWSDDRLLPERLARRETRFHPSVVARRAMSNC